MNKVDAMRIAGRVNCQAIYIGIQAIRPGIDLRQIDKIIEEYILEQKCEPAFKGYRDYPATACISVNDVAVHGIPGEYLIQAGDLITIDVGTSYRGWCVDAARSFVVPAPTIDKAAQHQYHRRLNLVSAAEKILTAELDTIRDGVSLWDIANAGEEQAKHQGVNLMVQWGGHQIGETIHIDPFIPNGFDHGKGPFVVKIQQKRLNSHKLHAGQTICLEPVVTFGCTDIMIDKDGWTVRTVDGSDVAHTERCLLITEQGYELLS